MLDPDGRLKVSREGDATLVELTDRKILDEMSISQIAEHLKALVAKADPPKFVIDFTNVAHMSSSVLGMLITLHKRILEANGQLRLCGIMPAIMEIFVITRLNEIFSIFNTREAALASLE